MALKEFTIEGIGAVTVYKRRGVRSIRLTIDSSGKVKVTMPPWAPYSTGLNFAKSKTAWLQNQLAGRQQQALKPNGAIGKQHRIDFIQLDGASVRSRVTRDGTIRVVHATDLLWSDESVQAVARRAAVRALRSEAESLLPNRLHQLAERHGFAYRSVTIKQLKSRWGSCDQDTNIVLNLYLMQLPWHLIDYVLLHELTHTKVMQHGPTFWQAMEATEPQAKQYRKEIREYRTILSH